MKSEQVSKYESNSMFLCVYGNIKWILCMRAKKSKTISTRLLKGTQLKMRLKEEINLEKNRPDQIQYEWFERIRFP